MDVNKIIISKKKFEDEPYLQVPISQMFGDLDRTDAIKRDFMDVEIDKAINKIKPYEVEKISPEATVHEYSFYIRLEAGNKLSDLGLTYDDLKYRTNRLTKSFLRFEFFDSDNIKTQTKIGEHTMFLSMIDEWYETTTNNNVAGVPKEPEDCEIIFRAKDPTRSINSVGEGFNLYLTRQPIYFLTNKTIYCRTTLNSAVDGYSYRLNSVSVNPQNLITLMANLHQKYVIKISNGLPTYTTGVFSGGNKVRVNLYEAIAL